LKLESANSTLTISISQSANLYDAA